MSTDTSRRGLLALVAAGAGYTILSNGEDSTILPALPGGGSADLLEIASGETVTIAASSSETYGGIDWAQGGELNWESGGSIQLENTA